MKRKITGKATAAVLGGLFVTAFLIQFTRYLPWPAELLTVLWTLRNGIHLTLLFLWCASVKRRIVSIPIRRMLIAVGCLLAFWLLVRSCKWEYIFSRQALLGCYCWYGYYAPMILIPLLGVFIVDHIGKPEGYHCPRWMMLLYIPAAILVALVFTNNLHNLVFTFPQGIAFYDSIYGYGILYYPIMGWFVVLGFYFVIMLMRKCRVPEAGKLRKYPLAIMLLAVLFWVAYSFAVPECDLTAINCVIIVMLLETAIRSGMIPSNINYQDLFWISSYSMQIVDHQGKLCYRSEVASELPMRVDASGETVVIHSNPISGGWVLWKEDAGQIHALRKLLGKRQAVLNQDNSLLKAEAELRRQQIKTAETARLYDQVVRSVAPQLHKVDDLLTKAERNPLDRRPILAQVCVLGSYIKRRGNLVLLGEQHASIPLKELEFCFRESLDNLQLSGVFTSINASVAGFASLEVICGVFDLYEAVVERLYGKMTAMLVHLSGKDERICIRIQIGCDGPVSHRILRALPSVEGSLRWQVQDEDILLDLRMGGDRT